MRDEKNTFTEAQAAAYPFGNNSQFFPALILVTFDQLVTSSIAPYFAACIVLGAVFYLPPVLSIPAFGINFLLYSILIRIIQGDLSVVSSNLLNGVTTAAVGLFRSLSFWTSRVNSIGQKLCIDRQQLELEEKNRQLAQLASIDILAGLLYRREPNKSLSYEIKKWRK